MNLAPAPIKNNIAKGLVAEKVWIDWFTQLVDFVKKSLHTYDPQWAGVVQMAGGTATVANTNVTASMVVSMNPQSTGNTGFLSVTINAGVGFTITSTSGVDNRTVFYQVFESL